MNVVFAFRAEDRVAGGRSLSTLRTRTNLTSVTVRGQKASLHVTISVGVHIH